MTEQDKRLLTTEKELEIAEKTGKWVMHGEIEPYLEAQREMTLREVIDFLEKHKVRTGAQKGWHISFTETTWQALKQGRLPNE